MSKYVKRPIVIEAVRCAGEIYNAANDWSSMPKWLADAYENGNILFLPTSIEIFTLEGRMIANKGDWIIRGVQGEIYPCKPDIFAATYELAP